MKKRLLSVLLCIALTLGLVGGAFAATGGVSKILNYDNITVALNGRTVEMINEKGAAVEPFAIDGTTYLPVRALSKALGLYVDWDAANSKVILSETPIAEPSDELTIYFVRHGKTFFNTLGRVQGFVDSPLTETGISQGRATGKGMSDIQFTTAYVGTLGRQRNTAQLILGENANRIPSIVENVGFNEWNYGGYEGGSDADMWNPVFKQFGYEFDENWTHYNAVYEKLGDRGIADAIAANDVHKAAETYDQILARAGAGMDQLVKESLAAGGGNVLVVSSGSQIPTILEMIAPGAYQGEDIGNCSVTTVKYADGKYTIETIGDLSYRDGK